MADNIRRNNSFKWYQGPTLVDCFDLLEKPNIPNWRNLPFRFVCQAVHRIPGIGKQKSTKASHLQVFVLFNFFRNCLCWNSSPRHSETEQLCKWIQLSKTRI